MNHNAVGALNQAEVLVALQDEGDGVLEIENVGSVPVGYVVDVAVVGSSGDEVVVADGHVYDSVLEIKVLLELNVLREDVRHFNAVLIVQVRLPIVVRHIFIHNLTENNVSVSTRTST